MIAGKGVGEYLVISGVAWCPVSHSVSRRVLMVASLTVENYWHNTDEKTHWVLDKKRFVSKNENVKSNIKITEINCDKKKYRRL